MKIKIQYNLLISSLFILILSTTGFSQSSEFNEEPVVIPKEIMEQITKKVLIHYFKPRGQRKIIYLSDKFIQKSWLPQIKGINFQLIDIGQQPYRAMNHFMFKYPLFEDKQSIGFGYGSGGSGYSGDIWKFKITKQRVEIWKDTDGWGSSGDDYGDSHNVPTFLLMSLPIKRGQRKLIALSLLQ